METEQATPLADTPDMTDEERYRVLVEWNDTGKEYPVDVCLHQLFEAQVDRTPGAVAVVFEGTQMTYGELDHRANQLAHYLRGLGVGPEVLVGVFMERSIEMIIALYGTLKAGGAYVPLDPEYPPDRVAFMLEDTQVPVLLTQKTLMGGLHNVTALAKQDEYDGLSTLNPPIGNLTVVCLDSDWATIAKESADNPVSGATAENLAYVIYTSGSTGRPKGVMNCHQGICNRLFWMQDAYQLTDADRVLQKTPFSFDVSVWEFFWPLLVGARLIVARPGGHRDSGYLVDQILEQEITTLHFVPSMLQLFLSETRVRRCHSLKRVICSGEALPYELQERFFVRSDAELHNLYGPTEAAVDVTYWACQQGNDFGFVPIGKPVANTEIYLLDSHMQPVPVGVNGELHIGGVQVARGYLNRPELTSEKFIPDPFSDMPGARLYKTGDLARYLPDGNIEFLGRIDFQVKIRGNRVELGEIESLLERHSAIQRAVVLAREDEPGNKRLVAYLVGNTGEQLVTTQLRLYLQHKLPEFMIPSAFVLLEAMPLTPNGKIDRRALPAPDNKRPELDQAYVPPRTELENYLADIWRELLRLDQVGIHDRFFELGGNSLQAAQFINRLQYELGENIYIVSVFEAPSIAQYAEFLKKDYADAVTERFGVARTSGHDSRSDRIITADGEKIDSEAIARMRECIPSLSSWNGGDRKDRKNPPAIFILAPPRSGTTLLRVMLAGHPDLFAATELQLLGFNTLDERRRAFSGKFSLWLEGTIRTIMEIKNCDADDAKGIMAEYEQRHCTTKQFYRVLQNWIGDRTIVDKSPSYVLDLKSLEKAERDFRNPLYIHLVRHPYATVRSFERYHMDQVLYLKDHPFSRRHLAELVWLVSHKNAAQFLQKVPGNRQYLMRFEDLVNQPQEIMEDMCQTLGLKFHPDLTKPYKDINKKMTDGIYEDSKPMGDTRLLDHGGIDPKVAQNWKGVLTDNFLSDITWELATSLGYERPDSPDKSRSTDRQAVRRRLAGSRRQLSAKHRQRRQQHRNSL